MAIYVYKRESIPSFTCTFSYTWSDQHYTVPYTWTYTLQACGAWSYSSLWGLGQWNFCLNGWDELSIVVGQAGSGVAQSCCTYGFWGSSTYTCRAGWGLSWVFTWAWQVLATDSDRALVIWWGAGWGCNQTYCWWDGWGECGWNGSSCGYGTAWAWGTQTWHGSWWNVGANQFNGGNGSWCTWYGWWGGRWWGNGSKWDSSCLCDDKAAWWWSWYVKDTAENKILTKSGGSAKCYHWKVNITLICWPLVSTPKVIWDIYLWCNS